jgi:hypothetical protein
MFGEWYQKTNKTEDTNKLTLLAFKIIAFHYALQAGKQKEVRRRQIRGVRWMIENRYA